MGRGNVAAIFGTVGSCMLVFMLLHRFADDSKPKRIEDAVETSSPWQRLEDLQDISEGLREITSEGLQAMMSTEYDFQLSQVSNIAAPDVVVENIKAEMRASIEMLASERPLQGATKHDTRPEERTCNSPEKIPWMFDGCPASESVAHGIDGTTCGVCSQSPYIIAFQEFAAKLKKWKEQECYRLLVYGVVLGDDYYKKFQEMARANPVGHPTNTHRVHGRCFLVFVNEESLKAYPNFPVTTSTDGLEELVPVPRAILPFQHNRRNVKIFKLLGSLLFPWVERLVWLDGEKFRRKLWRSYRPSNYFDYFDEVIERRGVCAAFMQAPRHESYFGSEDLQQLRYPRLDLHCKTIVQASKRRNNTDDPSALLQQCLHYYSQSSNSIESLTTYSRLIDSALIAWDQRSTRCRQFNADLGCKWIGEIRCYSDRDQVAFPFALASMGVQDRDNNVTLFKHDRILVDSQQRPTALLMSPLCHWYFRHLDVNGCIISDESTKRRKRVAIVVAGSLQRFLLNATAHHLILPMTAQGHTVDYFLSLTTDMQHSQQSKIIEDPIFDSVKSIFDTAPPERREERSKFEYRAAIIKRTVNLLIGSAGGNLRRANISRDIDIDSHPSVKVKREAALRLHPAEDPYSRFPTLDLREGNLKSAAEANRNMLQRHFSISELWKEVKEVEDSDGSKYDIVLFLREDASFLVDFDLNSLMSHGGADFYVLSCDDRDPPLSALEVPEHLIVASRRYADFYGMYFESLLRIEDCTQTLSASFASYSDWNAQLGCTPGMLFKSMLLGSRASVKSVGQSIVPFHREAFEKTTSGEVQTCIREKCQSRSREVLENDLVVSDARLCTSL